MANGTIKIKISVQREKPRKTISTVELWAKAARGLACVWDDDKFV